MCFVNTSGQIGKFECFVLHSMLTIEKYIQQFEFNYIVVARFGVFFSKCFCNFIGEFLFFDLAIQRVHITTDQINQLNRDFNFFFSKKE